MILFYSKYCTSTAICKCTTYLRAVNFKGRISWHGWIFDAARKANWVALISLVRPRCKRAQASPLAARRMKYLSVGSSSRSKPDVCGLSWVVFVDVLNFFLFLLCKAAKMSEYWISPPHFGTLSKSNSTVVHTPRNVDLPVLQVCIFNFSLNINQLVNISWKITSYFLLNQFYTKFWF